MAEETVETLELEIRARATSAAETVANLASSVSDFGKTVSQYMGNLNNLANVMTRIAESAKALNGVRNIRTVISGAASAAGQVKAQTVGKAFKPIIPPVRASSTVSGSNRAVRMPDGSIRKYHETADQIARSINRENSGTSYNNKELSAEIQAIRKLAVVGKDAEAMKATMDLSRELASSVGSKNINPLIRLLNSEFGGGHIGLTEKDIAAIGIGTSGLSSMIRNMGGHFDFRMRHPGALRNHTLRSFDEIDEETYRGAGVPDTNPETIVDSLLSSKWSGHKSQLSEMRAENDEQAYRQIFDGLVDRIFGSAAVEAKSEAETSSRKVVDDVKEEVKSAVQSIGGRQFFDAFNRRLGIGSTAISAKREAAVFMEQSGETDRVTEDIAKWKRLGDQIRSTGDELKKYLGEADSGVGPHNVNIHRTFDEYAGPDLKEANKQAVEDAEKRFSDIVEGPDAMKNMRANMDILKSYGVGHTQDFFKGLKANDDAIKAREEEARRIQEARDAEADLRQNSEMTSEQFMAENEQADVLQMKLDGVKQKLDEALNSDEYDPAKIARLAEQYQKLSDKIRETGDAAKDAKGGVGGFHSILSALGATIKKGFVGRLVTQFWRIGKMRAIRGIVKGIASAVKEGTNNMYQWSKAMNGAFAQSLDTISSKTMLVKNSIATAFAPAIQAAVPLISTLASWVNQASNAIAQFLSILSGSKTWTKAIETTEEWGAAAKKATGGASKDVKDLLADWDELNIIQSETRNGGGSGSTSKTSDYSKMFEETTQFDKWTEKFKNIKGIVDAIGAGIASLFVFTGIENFLKKMDLLEDKAGSVLRRLKKLALGAVMLKISFDLGEIAGAGVAENGITLATALESIGSLVAGGLGGYWVGGPGGIITGITFSLLIQLNAYVQKKHEMTYAQLAKNAFSKAGANGIDTQKYKEAIEKELNDRIGDLKISVSTFETYGTAADTLKKATENLKEMYSYISGDEALTAEQAETFRKNMDIVYQAISQMHTSTWDTINIGIADAMHTEVEEARKELDELQKQMIELKRLTGGAQAAYKEEMQQISQRITAGTYTEQDLQRYTVLLDLLSDMDASKSLEEMRRWGEYVGGFDFGDEEEAVQNASDFMDGMDDVYNNATEEVKAWGDAQKEAVRAAKRELEAYNKAGFITDEQYRNGLNLLDSWENKYTEKVKSDMEAIEDLKTQTYRDIFEQVLRGAVLNNANGGSIDEHIKNVKPIIEKLYQSGYELPVEFLGTITSYGGMIDWFHQLGQNGAHMFGLDEYTDLYTNGILPALREMLGDKEYDKYMADLFGEDGLDIFKDIEPYEIKPTATPEDAFQFTTPEGFELKDGKFYPVVGDPESTAQLKLEAGQTPDGFSLTEGSYKANTAAPDVAKIAIEGGDLPEWFIYDRARNKFTFQVDAPDGTKVLIGKELPEGIEYDEATGNFKFGVEDAYATVHLETDTGNLTFNEDGTWEYTPKETKTVTLDNPKWSQTENGWVRNDVADGLGAATESIDEVTGTLEELETVIDESSSPWDDDGPITWYVGDSTGASSPTGWYGGVPDESFELDTSMAGLATDENVDSLAESTAQGMDSIESVLNLMRTAMANIEEYARQTAGKDMTVVVNPTSMRGRVNQIANDMFNAVTGQGG